VIVFTRADQLIPDHGKKPTPSTWERMRADVPPFQVWPEDLALATCPNGHTLRIVSTVHKIAADGTLSPSYVCVAAGCGFHDFVRFEGWAESA
jgi:hypothetical protein